MCLMPLDSFEYEGKWYKVGENVVFNSKEDVSDFIENSIEVTKTVSVPPFLFWGGYDVTAQVLVKNYEKTT